MYKTANQRAGSARVRASHVRRGSKRSRAGELKPTAAAASESAGESDWQATSSSDESSDDSVQGARKRRIARTDAMYPRTRALSPAARRRLLPWPSPGRTPRALHASPAAVTAHSPFCPRRTGQRANPVFLRSPISRRLRRLDDVAQRTPSLSPLQRRATRNSLRQAPGALQHRSSPQQRFSDAWMDESDLTSASEDQDSPDERSSDADESILAEIRPAPEQFQAPPGARRMRTRSVSQGTTVPEEEMGRSSPNPPVERPDMPSERSQPALLRRRRPSLVDMCRAQGLNPPVDATKAMLVDMIAQSTETGPKAAAPAESVIPAAEPPAEAKTTEEIQLLDLEQLDLVDHEIPPYKLEKLEKIGTGAVKDVFIGLYHVSRTKVIKVAIADIRNQLTDMDMKELMFLRDLQHENIVRFIGVSIPPEPRHVPCMIVSELCSNGDLFDYIRNTPAPSDVAIFRIMLSIARGLEYLHTRKPIIVHRDCKSTNVLITHDGRAKISDFGLARVRRTTRTTISSLVGTVNWQAVELWVPRPHYTEKVDVWSAAMTFWETLQWRQPEKRYPFQGMNEHQIYLNVGQKQQRYVWRATKLTAGHLLEAFGANLEVTW